MAKIAIAKMGLALILAWAGGLSDSVNAEQPRFGRTLG